MNKKDVSDIASKIEQEESIFAKKSFLDPLLFPGKIIGRTRQAEEIIRMLLGYKQGFVVPFVSVYGRSGSGKSVTTKFVCENLDGISFVLVNLRQARTIFGAANLILGELGMPNLKSAQGINLAIDIIGQAIESRLGSKKLFVLALDEFDVIFFDKRNKPSDFVYKMVLLEENLRKKGILLCIITISNNVLSEYELDDRVKSRIGSSEIFFEPYSKSDLLEILKDRAKSAFAKKIDGLVLDHCAELGSSEHGDARRAIDLLRVASEIAISKGEELSVSHVDKASDRLQKDRAEKIIEGASYHFRLVCGGLARATFLSGQAMHSTSTIYKQYGKILEKGVKPLTYRRIHDILTEMENTGLVQSQTSSRGRHGYGTQYKLAMPPEMVGRAISKEWWQGIEKAKLEHESSAKRGHSFGSLAKKSPFIKTLQETNDIIWKSYVGL